MRAPANHATACAGLLVLAAGLLAAGPAGAAERWQFLPALTLTGEFTDNVSMVPDQGPGRREADVSISAVPSAALRYNTYATEALIRATPTFRYFFLHPGNNTRSLLDSMGVDLEYRRWLSQHVQLEATEHLLYFLDVQAQPAAAVVIPRQESFVNTLSLALSHQVATRTKMVYTASVATQEFKDATVDDSVDYSPGLSVEQTVSQNVTLRVFGAWRRALFSRRYDLIRGVIDPRAYRSRIPFDLASSNDFDLYVAGVGVVYRITPTLSLTADSGVLVPVHEVAHVYKTSHLDWLQSVALDKTFDRMQLILRYSRDIAPTEGLSDQVLNQTVTLQFSREWVRDLRTTFTADYGHYDATAVTIDQIRVAADLHYMVLPWLGIGGGYQYTYQQSKVGTAHPRVKENQVTLSLSFLPPRPDALRF